MKKLLTSDYKETDIQTDEGHNPVQIADLEYFVLK